MAAYGGSYPGSFIPMLEAARVAVEARGWSYEAVFSDGVERHQWHSEMRARGVRTRVAPQMGVRAKTAWVRRLLDEDAGPTMLHTHFSWWDIPVALAAGPRGEAAVIWHLHTHLPHGIRGRARNLLRFVLARRFVDRIVCVAPEIRDRAVARLAPSGRTQVVPNGIDAARFASVAAAEGAQARARLGLPAGCTVVLMFAWHWETKGGPLLLETLQQLRRRGREVHAVVVGSENRARVAAVRLGLDDLVHPIQPVEDARTLYGAADIFIAASFSEGMPFALLEAVACGTPVVASDIPGHRFAGAALPACRLVSRLPVAFADGISEELSTGAQERARRVAQSRAIVERDFSLEQWSQRLLALYDDVLAKRAVSSPSLAHTGPV